MKFHFRGGIIAYKIYILNAHRIVELKATKREFDFRVFISYKDKYKEFYNIVIFIYSFRLVKTFFTIG